MEYNQLNNTLHDLKKRTTELVGYLNLNQKKQRLMEIEKELNQPDVWSNPQRAKKLNQEKAPLEDIIESLDTIDRELDDVLELVDLCQGDEQEWPALSETVRDLVKQVEAMEFQKMFSGEMDECSAYLDIQAGSGGTEAQDWAEMLQRMYLRWVESKGWKSEVLDLMPGDVAGIKSVSIKVIGSYAYGWLRTERGVHRLVRKSPFDSGNRRHTSFAAVFISPEVSDDIEIDINPADLRVDTYRASGAGGQHVNTTDSAVRITHVPTGVVVQCQSDRSQHKNRAQAMKQLKSRLHQVAMEEKMSLQNEIEATKSDISWGNQIRSYVLDQSRIKDLRTGVENSNTQAVLDGDLNAFIEASLKMGVGDEPTSKES